MSVMKLGRETKRSGQPRDKPKKTANYEGRSEPEEEPDHDRLPYLSGDQLSKAMMLKRVEAVESKLQGRTRFNPEEFRKSQRLQYYKDLEKMMNEPPPTHHPTPKDKYMAKDAAKEEKQQRERQAISIKLAAKPPVKFIAKNALNEPSNADSTGFKVMPGRQPERLPPKPVAAQDGIFPLRKAKAQKVGERLAAAATEDYMSSVDMFVTKSDGTKKKKRKAQEKDNPKALSHSDIARAFGGHGDAADNAPQPGSGSEAVAKPPAFVKASMTDVAKTQPASSLVAPHDQDDDGKFKLHQHWGRS